MEEIKHPVVDVSTLHPDFIAPVFQSAAMIRCNMSRSFSSTASSSALICSLAIIFSTFAEILGTTVRPKGLLRKVFLGAKVESFESRGKTKPASDGVHEVIPIGGLTRPMGFQDSPHLTHYGAATLRSVAIGRGGRVEPHAVPADTYSLHGTCLQRRLSLCYNKLTVRVIRRRKCYPPTCFP